MESARKSVFEEQIDSYLRSNWKPTSSSSLYQVLKSGEESYLESLDSSITNRWQSELAASLSYWFQIPTNKLNLKVIKKLTNASLSPGVSGLLRTKDAVESWREAIDQISTLASLDGLLSKTGSAGDYELVLRPDKNKKCSQCNKSLKSYDFAVKYFDQDFNDVVLTHPVCTIAKLIRLEARDFRNAKGGINKQAKSVRAILSDDLVKKNQNLLKSPLNNYEDYRKWLDSLIATWKSNTDVKETFHASYVNNFKEFTDRMLESKYRPQRTIHLAGEKLSKHFQKQSFLDILQEYSDSIKSEKAKKDSPESPTPTAKTQLIKNIKIDAYKDMRQVGESFRDGYSVILDLSDCPSAERKRIVDFVSGLVFGLNATIERISSNVFLLSNSGVTIVANPKSRIDSSNSESELVKLFA